MIITIINKTVLETNIANYYLNYIMNMITIFSNFLISENWLC